MYVFTFIKIALYGNCVNQLCIIKIWVVYASEQRLTVICTQSSCSMANETLHLVTCIGSTPVVKLPTVFLKARDK